MSAYGYKPKFAAPPGYDRTTSRSRRSRPTGRLRCLRDAPSAVFAPGLDRLELHDRRDRRLDLRQQGHPLRPRVVAAQLAHHAHHNGTRDQPRRLVRTIEQASEGMRRQHARRRRDGFFCEGSIDTGTESVRDDSRTSPGTASLTWYAGDAWGRTPDQPRSPPPSRSCLVDVPGGTGARSRTFRQAPFATCCNEDPHALTKDPASDPGSATSQAAPP